MVKELVARGFKGQALRDEIARLTGLRGPDAGLLVSVELRGRGDTDPPLGPAPSISDLLAMLPPRGDESAT